MGAVLVAPSFSKTIPQSVSKPVETGAKVAKKSFEGVKLNPRNKGCKL